MNERSSSPEQLIEKMRISSPVTWVTLFLLAFILCAGSVFFLSQRVYLREEHPCFVTAEVSPVDQALLEIYQSSGGHTEYTLDSIHRIFGARADGIAQRAILFIEDIENSEISEGTQVSIDSKSGYVVLLLNAKMTYSELAELGVTDGMLVEAKLIPGRAYYAAIVLVRLENEEEALPTSFYHSSVLLDEFDVKSLVFR